MERSDYLDFNMSPTYRQNSVPIATRAATACALSLALIASAGCPAGGAAKTIRGKAPTTTDATGGSDKCEPSGSYDALAVDWDPELRGDFEVAMKQGVAVVSYDCQSLRLLEECSIDGGYGYIGMTRKEKVIKMKDEDEVKANLPTTGIKWLGEAGVSLERGRSLDVAMIMVGKKSTGRRDKSATLVGDCDGATHYVTGATIGAFAMASTSDAKVAAAAKFFDKGASGESESDLKIHNKDGSLEACAKSTSDDKKAPAECGAVLRLKLKPVPAAAPSGDDAIDVVSCPPGTVQKDGACVKPEADEPQQCRVGDEAGCKKQCDAGDAASCFILGEMHFRGIGVSTDRAAAVELLGKACEGGYLDGCRAAGKAVWDGKGAKKDAKKAREFLDRACTGGSAIGCVELGDLLLEQDSGQDALMLFRKACYGGEYEGCGRIGALYLKGKAGLRKKPKLASKFFEKGCKEGSMYACTELAGLYESGKGVRKNKKKAQELRQRACDKGYEKACE